jgi:hypothetical protein
MLRVPSPISIPTVEEKVSTQRPTVATHNTSDKAEIPENSHRPSRFIDADCTMILSNAVFPVSPKRVAILAHDGAIHYNFHRVDLTICIAERDPKSKRTHA